MKKIPLILLLLIGGIFVNADAYAQTPIFDAHVHYSQPDWAVYSPAAIFRFFDEAQVQWAMVSSTPDEGTLRLYELAPQRIVPILRPYRTRGDMGTWFKDPSILAYVEQRFQKGIYRGIGEFHLPAGEAKSEVVKGFIRLAARSGIFLYAHTDEIGIEELLNLEPKVRILWAHAGFSATTQKISLLLDRFPTLFVETSIRNDYASGGKLNPNWRDLFLRHPDRFMIGSDTWTTSRWESFVEIHKEIRAWLNQLPPNISGNLSIHNARRLSAEKP